MATELVPPATGAEWDAGSTVTAHPEDCVTVIGTPAMIALPLRAGPSLAAIDIRTTPAPVPLLPFAIVIQGDWLCAVHAHPAGAATDTSAMPPDALIVTDVTPVA
jgi:hypothetical protein